MKKDSTRMKKPFTAPDCVSADSAAPAADSPTGRLIRPSQKAGLPPPNALLPQLRLQHFTQLGWRHRLVEQRKSARARFAHAIGGRVAGD
jgi:hypothetical protein